MITGLLLFQRPCQVDEQEGFGCSCFAKVIQVTVQTDRIGYCPGESIAVSAFINNPTSNRINGVEIILFQNSFYTIKSGESYLLSFFMVLHL